MGREIVVACLDRRGVVETADDGTPLAFRWPCRNRKCCPPREGFRAIHRMVLFSCEGRSVGDLATTYEAIRPRPISDLVDALPPDRVRREGPAQQP